MKNLRDFPAPPTVHASMDYAAFKFENNRELNQANVNKLKRLHQEGQFYPHNVPILVDRNGVIKDGQHRFAVCKEYGIPVYFIRDERLASPEETMALNQAGARHTVPDRLRILKDSNSALGGQVRTCLRFWEDYGKPYGLTKTLIAQLLLNFYDGEPVGNALLNGNFRVNCEVETLQFIQWLNSLAKGDFKYEKAFIMAVIALIKAAGDREQVYVRLKANESKITAEPDTDSYKRTLLEIFNHKKQGQNRLSLRKLPAAQVATAEV